MRNRQFSLTVYPALDSYPFYTFVCECEYYVCVCVCVFRHSFFHNVYDNIFYYPLYNEIKTFYGKRSNDYKFKTTAQKKNLPVKD